MPKRLARRIQRLKSVVGAQRQHEERRRQLRYEIAILCTIHARNIYEVFSPREAHQIQHADLYTARRILLRAAARLTTPRHLADRTATVAAQFSLLSNRPAAVLSRQNSSWINPTPDAALFATFWDDDAWTAEEAQASPPKPRRSATRARDVSRRRNGPQISGTTAPIDWSARFWESYRSGRVRYFEHSQSEGAEASLIALFNQAELGQLLPDVIIPRAYRRRGYLTNLIWRNKLCLDVFSATSARPLFRHYFAAA